MATLRNKMRNVSYLKPMKFSEHMTLQEVARKTGKDPSWIRRLENRGRIPRARRVKSGQLRVRLWSPEQVEEIQEVLANMKPGRPSSGR